VKVYLAGEVAGDKTIMQWMKRRLFSYWYHHEGDQPSQYVVDASEKYKLDLFLDSGAFTAFTQKVQIKIEDYAKYWHNVQQRFTVCSSLDAIGDPAKTYEHLKDLESLGCYVQPVYHAREPVEWLCRYIDEGYDYIFIGGMVPETTGWLRGWLDGLFTNYLCYRDGTPRVKLHGFGLTDQALMFRYPWHSVDSTSWIFTGMFGNCVFMTETGLEKVTFSKKSPNAKKIRDTQFYRGPETDGSNPYAKMDVPQRQRIDKLLERHGITAAQCAESYLFRNRVNATTFNEMELLGATRFDPILMQSARGLFPDVA
jgi:hypothetical protein